MDPFTLAAIAGPAIGSLFRKKEKPTEAKLDLGFLRKEAEENGFNPFSVLQATGGAGSILGGSSGGNMLAGDMVMASLSTLSQYGLDKASDDRTAAREDLRAANERATARGYIGGVQVGSSGMASRPVASALSGAPLSAYTNGGDPYAVAVGGGKAVAGSIYDGIAYKGMAWMMDRATADAQTVSDAYGDTAEEFWGFAKMMADWDANPAIQQRMKTDLKQSAYDHLLRDDVNAAKRVGNQLLALPTPSALWQKIKPKGAPVSPGVGFGSDRPYGRSTAW